MIIHKIFLVVIGTFWLSGCGHLVLPATTDEAAQSNFGHAFVQNERLGRGVNLGNALEAPYEGAWGMTLSEAYFAEIARVGFASVRVPIKWSAYAEEQPPYALNEKIFARVDWVLEQAQANGLNAILNIHHYDEMFSDPAGQRARFLAIWQQIATRYRDQPENVYFEILNEPHDRLQDANWQPLWREALAVIRQSNPRRTVIVGPTQWNSIERLSAMQLPTDEKNLIVTFHYYSPFEFTHQGAEWATGAHAWLGTTWTGSESEMQAIRRAFDLAASWSEKNATPLFLGEFGAYDRADMDSRVRWTAFMRQEAEARGFSWAYWEFGAGFGVYDRAATQWRMPLLKALIPEAE